jgi:hypothetical protein
LERGIFSAETCGEVPFTGSDVVGHRRGSRLGRLDNLDKGELLENVTRVFRMC